MPRVLVVDSAAAYRRGLGVAFKEADFQVEEAVNLEGWDASRRPDVLVISIRSPAHLDAVGDTVSSGSGTIVVALVEAREPDEVADALRAGVAGVVERDASPELVVDAVRAALEHHAVIPLWAAGAFASRIPSRPPGEQWIGEEEAEWLRLLAQGVTVATLADTVGYSEREMFRNLHDLYSRIRVRNRTGALLWAERHGLLDPDPDGRGAGAG